MTRTTDKLYTLREAAKVCGVPHQHLPGLCMGLGIYPRRAGSAQTLTSDEVDRLRRHVQNYQAAESRSAS